MPNPVTRRLVTLMGGAGALLTTSGLVAPAQAGRRLTVDLDRPTTPRNELSRFSIGSDYSATTLREENLVQLRVAQRELGFRYIRFHDIFHDDMGVYRDVDGAAVYDWGAA